MADAALLERKLQRALNALAQAEALLESESLRVYREMQQREQAEQALRESEERYRMLVERSPDAILLEADNRLVFANPAAERLLQASHASDLLQHSMLTLAAPSCSREVALKLEKLARGDICGTEEEQLLRLDGTIIDVAITRVLLNYHGKPVIQMVVRDISERKHLETMLQFQATHDELTGLPNRYLFMDRMKRAISYGRRHDKRFVVSFIDLDRFKWVNDSLGHEAGDDLLKVVAQRISACLRETDTVARVGGDEFLLLLQDARNCSEAAPVISRVMAAICEPLQLHDREVTVSCSIGCSAFPDDGQDAETLLKFADAAMYCAKDAGRNNVQIYNAELRHRIDERLRLETELRHAIEREQLTLHYQVQVELRTGVIRGVEALLRWNHPELGLVMPSRFISIAEETGLIEPIGEWVLQRACMQNKAWQDAGIEPVRIAVNLSAKQLAVPGLVKRVADCLATTGLKPEYLELELTESASMSDPESTIPLFHEMKALGISISIDDFGTGYSNMQYLTNLPIDCLKLDGSFVRHVTRDPGRLAIVEAVIAMAHRLGLKTVGEMAETDGQILRLAESGCDYVQGHYFSAALPADECAVLLRESRLPLPQAQLNQHAMRTLLILDDEPLVISALRRALNKEDYRVISACNADEAFEQLAQHRVDVVLSDLTLPGQNGIEFLSKVMKMYPQVVRLILTGRRDFEAATDAINRGAVHRYLTKPWKNGELRDVLAEAFNQRTGQLW
jgi:diguanylate cyclase (GGDEF)-like protein/PAS domain S-box-containing protein